MDDKNKTKEQLLIELVELRQQIAELLETQHKQLEEALRKSEEKYKQLFATVSDAIMIFDADTRQFIDVNDAALHLYGYTQEEFLKLRHTDITAEPEESDVSIKQTLDRKLTKIPLRYHKKKDGTVFPVEISAGSFNWMNRRIICGVIRDITERKEAEDMVRSLEKAVETMQLGVTITDTKGKIIYTNSAEAKMHGYQVTELIGKDVRIFAPSKMWKPMTFEQMKQIGSRRRESVNIRKDGSIFPVQLMSDVVTNTVGDPVGIVTTCEDITKRKQVEEELEKLAITDILTQAYNRVKFEEIIKREIERVKRYNHALSVIMFDIDYFKEVNDKHGHIVGDYILKSVADIVRENMRKIDHLIRWGGEEFIIIAPETDLKRAEVLAERMREAIENYRFYNIGKVTVSFGVTQFKKDDTGDTFIKRADDALYIAKTNGRNRVEVIV